MKAHYDFEQTGSTLENKATALSDYTTNISGSLDEFFVNSDALTSTEVSNIKSRGIDTWTVLSNPNDYALLQTELPNNSVNESGSTGEEIDFTDNEFLIHGLETVTLASSIETHRDSNTWLSLGFKLADETLNSNNRGIDVSPTEESGTDATLTVVAGGTTYTLVATEDLAARGDQNSGCDGSGSGSILDSSAEWFAVTAYPSGSSYNKCVRGMAEFDISTIPTSATVTDATMTWKVDWNGLDSSDRIAIYVMDSQGTTLTQYNDLYNGIATGTLVSDTVEITGTGEKTFSVLDGGPQTTIPDKSANSIPITVPAVTETVLGFGTWTDATFDSSSSWGVNINNGNEISHSGGSSWTSNMARTTGGVATVGQGEFSLKITNANYQGGLQNAMCGFENVNGNFNYFTSGSHMDFGYYIAGGGGIHDRLGPNQPGVDYADFIVDGINLGNISQGNGNMAPHMDGTTGQTGSMADVFEIRIDNNGVVKYYVNDVYHVTSANTASGTYDLMFQSYGSNSRCHFELGTDPIIERSAEATSTTGTIGTAILNPVLTYSDSNLPDNTDDFSIGSWVKLDAPSPLTVDDDLTSDNGWTSNTGSWTYNSGGYIDFATITRSTTAQQIYIDVQDSDYLGSGNNLDDDKWVAQFKIKTGTQSSSTGNVIWYLGFSNNLGDSGTTQQTVSMSTNVNGGASENNLKLDVSSGNFETTGTPDRIRDDVLSSTNLPYSTDLYMELVRDGDDVYIKGIY